MTIENLICLGLGVLLGLAAFLAAGAKGGDPQFVARANSLNPTPIASQAPVAPVVKEEVVHSPTPPEVPSQASSAPSGAIGESGGYALPWGNCVDEPGVKRGQGGNPISWRPSTQTPYVGATFLMHTNHTGVVVGVHGDTIIVRHRNWQGGQYVFPRSMFRGFI